MRGVQFSESFLMEVFSLVRFSRAAAVYLIVVFNFSRSFARSPYYPTYYICLGINPVCNTPIVDTCPLYFRLILITAPTEFTVDRGLGPKSLCSSEVVVLLRRSIIVLSHTTSPNLFMDTFIC